MSADQFFQVVLLPQGEFAQFLRADSRQRGELLQRLFATERFQLVEEWLVARRISTAATVAAARQELAVLAARLAQSAGVPAPEALTPEWAPALLDAAAVDCRQAQSAARAATVLRDAARGAVERTSQVQALQQRRSSALARQRSLDDLRPVHEALELELKAAARAAELLGVLDDAAERERAAAVAGTAEAAARASLAAVAVPVDAGPAALRSAADAARRRVGRLEALRGVADALADERTTQAGADGEAERLTAALQGLDARLAVLPERQAVARATVDAARDAVQALPRAEARATLLAAACGEARGLQASLARAERLREEHVVAREVLVSSREREQVLREARFVSMVAELADRLEDGAPCEVCGSTAHPDPYLGDGDDVTRDDEERARRAAERAARDVADVEARAAAEAAVATGHRDRLLASGHADVDLAVLEQQEAAAHHEVGVLRDGARRLDQATAALEALEREAADAEADRVRLSTGRDGAVRRAAEAAARADTAAARLDGELGGAPDLETALVAAAGCATACDAVLLAVDDAERASAEAVRAAAAALSAADAAGFADVAAARSAVRATRWRDDAQARLRAGDDERAAVEAALADPELQDLPAEPVDLAGRPRPCVRPTCGSGGRALEAAGGGRPAPARAARAAAVSAQAAGPARAGRRAGAPARRPLLGRWRNALRMTLTSFVLAARLEEVAAVASQRLLRMTQGRYSLVHTDGAVKGGRQVRARLLRADRLDRAGPGDQHPVRRRDVPRLAGPRARPGRRRAGEAGGTRIEALFVDEGFGTLDEDTLDEVMDVLDGLREGGAWSGLVSHVAELRARIPAQVHVRKTRRGSDVVLLGC
jgi:exonuclease SbcC